jgi:TonB family protein
MAGTTNKLLRIAIIDDATKQRIDERVIRTHQDITIGTASDNTFVIKGASAPRKRRIFEARADGVWAFVFDRDLEGRVDVSGTPESIAELTKHPKAEKKEQQFLLPLPVTVKGRVVIAGHMLLFQLVDAPVQAAAPSAAAKGPIRAGGILHQIDWPFAYIMAASFILLGGTTTGMEVWWRQTGQYYYQPLQEGRQRLYELVKTEFAKPDKEEEKPEKPEETEKPEEDPKAAEAEAPPEPTPEPPKPKAASVKKAAQAKASSSAGDRAKDRAKVSAAVRQKTFLHVLGSAGGGPGGELNTLRSGAHQAALDSAFDAAGGVTNDRSGSGAFAAAGPSAVDGDGSGGGRYKGLTEADKGGGRIDTTQVKTEQKADREVTIKANIGGGSVSGGEGTGTIDRDAVTSVFSRRKGAIKSCYERALKSNPNVKGKVTIKFTIGPAGRITDISVAANTTGDGEIGDCIIEKVRGWKFDPPSGGSVTFSYPFLLDTK